MIYCKRCNGRMFIDRQYSNVDHLETYCLSCGNRRFFHPPSESRQGQWLLDQEKLRAKTIITSL